MKIPQKSRILCYGDSNTWGCIPGGEIGAQQRYSPEIRWTGILQQKLAPNYLVLEEGLLGRTTDFDDPNRVGKNGLTYLHPCLESQAPLDVIILMLGTNDCKERYHRQPVEIGEGIGRLLAKISELAGQAKVLLMSPPLIDETAPDIKTRYLGAELKTKQLGPVLEKVAEENQVGYLDLAKIVTPSPRDGCHLEISEHAKVAEAVLAKLKELHYVNLA